jgi:hypothetical protein
MQHTKAILTPPSQMQLDCERSDFGVKRPDRRHRGIEANDSKPSSRSAFDRQILSIKFEVQGLMISRPIRLTSRSKIARRQLASSPAFSPWGSQISVVVCGVPYDARTPLSLRQLTDQATPPCRERGKRGGITAIGNLLTDVEKGGVREGKAAVGLRVIR